MLRVEDVTRAREGDAEALGNVWRHFQPALLRYLRAKRVSDPDDVASQVWIDAAGSISGFNGDVGDLRRWLFTIAHRRSVDEVRRAVRRPETLDADAGVDATVPGAEEVYVDTTSLDRAIRLVRQLPPDMAEAVMLRIVGEMPVADVAAVMSCSEGNVRVLVHRGLKRLSSALSVTDPSLSTMEQLS
jgi:RNA polymerase sigma-70 factor (ECF subfamily)